MKQENTTTPQAKTPKKINIVQLVFVIVFAIIISIFPIFMLCGASAGKNYEQKVLAKLPEIQDLFLKYPTFSGDFEEYYNDHFPYRSTIVQQYSLMEYKVFKSSILPTNTSVGKDGWLFYEGYGTRKAVSGQNKLSNAQLKSIYDGIVKKYNKLKSLGKEYIVYLAPEKQMIYPEYDKLYHAEYTNCDQLVEYLIAKNCPATIIYGKDFLVANKDKGQIYFKYDTHWNKLGSYYGYVDIMNHIKQLLPNKNITIAQDFELSSYVNSGDLAGTLFLTEYLKESCPSIKHTYSYTTQAVDENFNEYISNTPSELKVFIYGDSFAQAHYWASHFAQSSSQTRILHNKNNFATLLKYVGDSNVVIEECVQRVPSTLAKCEF